MSAETPPQPPLAGAYVPLPTLLFCLSSFAVAVHCSARWIGNHGFSIGIDDVQPSARLRREKEVAVAQGYEASVAAIRAFNEGRLALQPGCNAAQTLEAQITGALNRIREECGKVRMMPKMVMMMPKPETWSLGSDSECRWHLLRVRGALEISETEGKGGPASGL